MLERILVPLDDASLSHRILTVVRCLMRGNPRGELCLVRVLTRAEAEPTEKTDPVVDARAHLDHTVELLSRNGLNASSTLRIGDPASEILDAAEDFDPSLIAMASHGRSGVERWIRGSVAERVLESASHPLLLANPISLPADPWWERDTCSPVLARETEFRRILVPLDGSDGALAIFPLVLELARVHDSEVTLLHVATPGEPPLAPSLEALEPRFDGTNVRSLTREGDPARVILDEAGERGYDLVALTTHGRSRVSRWVFGSVAEHVLRHCAVPLLVKHTAGFAARSSGARPRAVALPTE